MNFGPVNLESCKMFKIVEKILLKRPLKVQSSKFCSESFHHNTDWHVVFQFY